MMGEEPIHRNLHPELHSLLLLFHEINGDVLRSVWRLYEEGTLVKIRLGFENRSLFIQADPYDDTIVLELFSTNDCSTAGWTNASSSEPWSTFIGERFGWGWIAINQQDALDGILLSFSGIMPQLFLTVMASSLKENIVVAIA